jgi:alpha-2-macroglobulin
MIKNRYHLAFLLSLFIILSLGFIIGQPAQQAPKPKPANTTVEWSGNFADGWKQFEQLLSEQKNEAAASLVENMLASARSAKNSAELTRCLIRYTQLRISLHGYETAVRFLKDQPWPEDVTGSSVLNLYYAGALTNYARNYSWEINKREKIDTKGVVDLKAWTRDQIYEEAQKAFENVWKNREQLGSMPNNQWKEYLTPNSYPPGIRPTLRDSVSYLRVDMLADTNGWQPEQLNEIYRLNLKSLVSSNVGEVSLVNPSRHPLEKICFILADLENWHAGKKEPEAALEARLERYRQINQHFSEAEDKKLIQSDLENRLKTLTDAPWWSEGMAQLADFVRAEGESDSLVRARQIAIQGRTAFPDSVGGKHCLAIEKQIESPAYSLSGMQNDNPQKKSLLITHQNLTKIFFRAYAIDIFKTIETSKDYNLLPNGKDLQELIASSSPAQQWETALPATPDYRMHKTFIIPPMKNTGVYLVVASARPGFSKTDNMLQGLYITISDLVLVTRLNGLDAQVTALTGSTGKPIAGAEVMLYKLDYNRGHQRIDSKLSDEHGIVEFHMATEYSQHFLVARKGDQITLDPNHIYAYRNQPQRDNSSTLIYTDRSIYRPLQKVFWKAVLYRSSSNGTRFDTSPASTFEISLQDINHQKVSTQTVTTNSFGTASGEFMIPSGRALGQWYLISSWGGAAFVRVEEYKRPTFETKFLDPEEPLRLNQQARLKGEAKYYFGLPVTNGQVKWLVRREPVYPWWWGYCWWGGFGFGSPRSQVVASGTAALKEDGTFSFTFSPEIDERLGKNKDVTYRYSVSADITDEGGETRSAQRSFRLGFVSVEASASLENAFFLKDDAVNISVLRTNLDGVAKAGKGTWRIAALKGPAETLLPAAQPYFIPKEYKAKSGFQTPGDLERERWNHGYNSEAILLQWEEGAIQASGTVMHDAKGEGKIAASHLAPGAYRLIYETSDDFGAKSELQKNFIVAAPSMKLLLPAMFMLEKPSVQVGNTARFLVHSGIKDQHVVFEIYRDGKCIQRKELHSGVDSSLVEIPITENDRGGLSISMTLVRDNQLVTVQRSFMVPWDSKELKVQFTTFRDRLRPGQEEKWSVKVTGPARKDVAVPAAELLAYMYDRSLDAFVPHSPFFPIGLYPYLARAIPVRANLGPASQIWLENRGFNPTPQAPYFTRDQLIFYNSYGIGGPGQRVFGGIVGGVAGGVADGVMRREAVMNEAQVMNAPAPSMLAMKAASVAPEEKEKKGADVEQGIAPGSAIELRSDFSETAFWQPHLLTGADGSVTFEFKVPDSVTSWNVWVHAITRDLKSGSVNREAKTVKELMVRPYLPRFLREGDQAEIKVVVNNASDKELKGTLNFDIIDTATDQSILSQFGLPKSETDGKPFTVPASGGTNLTFPIKTPSKVGQIAFKVTATSGDFSDGELRPIPILPGRMHLMQSRFITMSDPGQRVMRFEDLARNNDPTRINEQMVVTLDAQLFYSVLSALPYLVNYPYECTEQTLNRFVSTGILSSLYQQYPAIDRMAKEFSSRLTQFEQWDTPDPNRKMALEETPWLQMAKGGDRDASGLINVLDSRIAKAQRESAIAKLRQSQTSIGGFPWFPGGPPSPYMTLYLLNGFSKALEFGVDVPREMVQPAWNYMHRNYLDDVVKEMVAQDSGWEFVTFINYVLSNYPDAKWYEGTFTPAERKTMLDFSFKHWKDHSPYLKGYLALTLKRMGRTKDAMLVWESVMDSAKTAEDQGTFWAPEDRAWLWYNDTIETHAFAIRTDMELIPADPKLDGMVLWLFLNKKMNHWKSTRATAEVIYSLAHYLKTSGQLGIKEDATVTIGNHKTAFVFEPDQYTGKKNQIVIPGEKFNPKTTSAITVEKTSKGHLFASATWHFSTEQMPEEERGDYLRLTRTYFKRVNTGKEFTLQPLKEGATLAPGDEVEVHLSLTSKHPMEYVHLRDPRGAGFEPVSNLSKHKWESGLVWYEEIRDSGTNFFFEHIPQGEFTFKYRIRAATAGTFKVAPATVQPMYAPEFAAYSSGATINIQNAIDSKE